MTKGGGNVVSIHAPRVGRDRLFVAARILVDVSIHAPRVGRDPSTPMSLFGGGRFQSTRPVWGATSSRWSHSVVSKVSIHAPRVGRDGR